MKFPRQHHRPNEDERILPLTNVIFLLIIFFMLAGQLSNPDAMAIQPPRSVSESAAQHNGLLVEVTSEGRIALNGKAVTPEALKARVQDYLVKNSQQKSVGIRLKADALVDAARVVAVMSLLRKAGVQRLRLLTLPVQR